MIRPALFFTLFICSFTTVERISIAYDSGRDPVEYGVNKFRDALIVNGELLVTNSFAGLSSLPDVAVVVRGVSSKNFIVSIEGQSF